MTHKASALQNLKSYLTRPFGKKHTGIELVCFKSDAVKFLVESSARTGSEGGNARKKRKIKIQNGNLKSTESLRTYSHRGYLLWSSF